MADFVATDRQTDTALSSLQTSEAPGRQQQASQGEERRSGARAGDESLTRIRPRGKGRKEGRKSEVKSLFTPTAFASLPGRVNKETEDAAEAEPIRRQGSTFY